MIGRSNRYVFEDDLTPTAPGEALEGCLHIALAIGKYKIFFGGRGFFAGGVFEIFPWRSETIFP